MMGRLAARFARKFVGERGTQIDLLAPALARVIAPLHQRHSMRSDGSP